VSEQLGPELERVARMLADAGPLPDAPHTLRERALAIPDGDSPAVPDAGKVVAIGRRPRRRPRTQVLAGIAAVAAAIVIVPTVVVLHGRGGPEHVALDPRAFAPKGSGSVSVAKHDDGSATIAMRVWGLPAPGSGRTYEAWLGRDGDRRALGTFTTRLDGTATVSFTVSGSDLDSYRWVWVTSEPAGGSAQPSSRTALWGALT
jgi:Anti-sigma-K factor rskA